MFHQLGKHQARHAQQAKSMHADLMRLLATELDPSRLSASASGQWGGATCCAVPFPRHMARRDAQDRSMDTPDSDAIPTHANEAHTIHLSRAPGGAPRSARLHHLPQARPLAGPPQSPRTSLVRGPVTFHHCRGQLLPYCEELPTRSVGEIPTRSRLITPAQGCLEPGRCLRQG